MFIIGLKGRLRSGKDTAFDYLSAKGTRIKRVAFADKLKLSGIKALGGEPITVEEAVEAADLLKEHGTVTTTVDGQAFTISGRKFWQLYGTEAHRDVFDPDFWVNALLPQPNASNGHSQVKLRERFPGIDTLVVTDTRFQNEALRILQLGGEVWEIDATQRLGALPEDSHPSEHPLPDHLVTRVVQNNGTFEDFYGELDHAYRGMLKGA